MHIGIRNLLHRSPEWLSPGATPLIEESSDQIAAASEALSVPAGAKLVRNSLYSCLVIVVVILFGLGDRVRAQPASDAFPPLTSLKVPDYVKVVDYTGRGPVLLGSALTPDPKKPIVIVIADEITLIDERFDYCNAAAPRQVILIADTIRMKGYTQFYLSRRILGMDPQPPCSSPYLAGPNLGQTLPPVLSIMARDLVAAKEGGVCMFCKLDAGKFDVGGITDPNVESAGRPSLTIIAEQMDISSKPDLFADTLAALFEPSDDTDGSAFLPFAAVAPFFWQSNVTNDAWAKPFFDEMTARLGKPPRIEDVELLRRFWKAGFQSAPEKVWPGMALTAQILERPDDAGIMKPRIDSDYLAYDRDAALFSNKLTEAGRNDPHAARAVSLWAVHTFQKIYLALQEADRLEQRNEVLRLLRTFTSLPSYPVRHEHLEAYFQAVDATKSIRDRYRNQLWRRAVQLEFANTPPQSVDLFSEGAAVETYVAPTQALVTERMVNGRLVLGTLRYQTAGAVQDVELKFQAELTVDPMVAEAVKTRLGQGELYKGQFSNWDLTARPLDYPGIKSSSIRISDNTLDVTLRLDGKTGTLALWQLTSDNGIPLTVDYEYRNDPAQKGKLITIPLSLARRKHSPIEVTPTGLRVTSPVIATINYIKLSNGQLHPLQPLLVINPGEIVAIPGIAADQLNGLSIPPEAISINALNPYSLNDFDNAQQVSLTERVTIKNIVPVTRVTRPGNLQYLALRIVYKTAEGEEQERQLTLAPAGITSSPGSQAQLTFVRISQQGQREIWLSGTAVYDNGTDTIAPRKFPAGDVLIDVETLAANPL